MTATAEAAKIQGSAEFQEDPPRRAELPESHDADALLLNIDGFEGPIDLLLELARNQRVDLSKISILQLARQYLSFVERAKAPTVSRVISL